MSLAPLSLSAVMSSLCTITVQWCLSRDWRVLKPELGRNSSFFEMLKSTVFLAEDAGGCSTPFTCGEGFIITFTPNTTSLAGTSWKKPAASTIEGKGDYVYQPLPWDTGCLQASLALVVRRARGSLYTQVCEQLVRAIAGPFS